MVDVLDVNVTWRQYIIVYMIILDESYCIL